MKILNNSNNHILTPDNAPKSYYVYLKCEHFLFLEVFERIKHKRKIFYKMSRSEIEKVKSLIIPALLYDRLIEEYEGGLRHLKNSLLFDSSFADKLIMVKNHHAYSRDICSKITEEDKNNYTTFNYTVKNVPKNKLDIINDKLIELKQLIKDLPDDDCNDSLDCYFSIMTHKQDSEEEKKGDKND